MRTVRSIVLAGVVFAAAAWMAPWWIVPIVAAGLALAFPRTCRPGVTALAASAAWAAILVVSAVQGPVYRLAGELGGLVGLPALVPPLVTVAWAGLIAWSAAAVMAREPRNAGVS